MDRCVRCPPPEPGVGPAAAPPQLLEPAKLPTEGTPTEGAPVPVAVATLVPKPIGGGGGGGGPGGGGGAAPAGPALTPGFDHALPCRCCCCCPSARLPAAPASVVAEPKAPAPPCRAEQPSPAGADVLRTLVAPGCWRPCWSCSCLPAASGPVVTSHHASAAATYMQQACTSESVTGKRAIRMHAGGAVLVACIIKPFSSGTESKVSRLPRLRNAPAAPNAHV